MEARLGDREKKIVKLGVKLLQVKLGKKATNSYIDSFLSSLCEDKNYEALSQVVKVLNKTVGYTKPKYQRKTLNAYGHLGLYLALNHPQISKFIFAVLGDITGIDTSKCEIKSDLTKTEIWLINRAIPFTYKKLVEQGTRLHYIIADMDSCTNKPCRHLLFKSIKENINLIEDEMFQETVMALSALFLWVMIRDTAYRDPFFWSLKQIANKGIKTLIRKSPYKLVKPPHLWYGNVWWDGRIDTKKRRASGELNYNEFDEKEQACVPGIQKRWAKEMMNRM